MKNNKEITNEYKLFESSEQVPPLILKKKISNQLRAYDSQLKKTVLFKIIATQIVISLVALLTCPQIPFSLTFDISFLHSIHEIYGAFICDFMCGVVVLSIGTVACFSMITVHEFQFILHHRYANPLYLLGLSTTLFIILGLNAFSLSIIIWGIGALIGHISGYALCFSLKSDLFN